MFRVKEERGSVSIIAAVLFGGGLVFGLAALVIDGGRLYVERAELQRAADAAALALAQECAGDTSRCTSAVLAKSFADANAEDGVHAVATICGSGGPGLTACPPSLTTSLCPVKGNRHIAVHLQTQALSGSNLVAPIFARALLGNGYDGSTVNACSVAGWGVPGNFDIRLGIAIDERCWSARNGAPAIDEDNSREAIAATWEQSIALQFGQAQVDCSGVNGGFSLLDQELSGPFACRPLIRTGAEVQVVSRVTITQQCRDYLRSSLNRTVPIAIYDPNFTVEDEKPNGAKLTLKIKGFAFFHVSGYRIPGNNLLEPPVHIQGCRGNDFCIYGWFTKAGVISANDIYFGSGDGEGSGEGIDYGLRVVRLIG
jgi:hypothetical protein